MIHPFTVFDTTFDQLRKTDIQDGKINMNLADADPYFPLIIREIVRPVFRCSLSQGTYPKLISTSESLERPVILVLRIGTTPVGTQAFDGVYCNYVIALRLRKFF